MTTTVGDLPLKAHQVEDVRWIREQKRGLLANEMGLGKTRSAIEAFDEIPGDCELLVVAPAAIVRAKVWQNEIAKWSRNPDRWVVTSYSMLNQRKGNRPVAALRPEYRKPFDGLVIDEAHYIKGRSTTWTRSVLEIARRTEWFLAITGTPIPNWSHELFTILQALHPGRVKPGGEYGSYWRWAERWFDCSPTRWSQGRPSVGDLLGCTRTCYLLPPEDPCDHYLRFAEENLGGKMRRVLRDECPDLALPPLYYTRVPFELSTEARQIYRDMRDQYVAQVDDEEIVSWNNGSRAVALAKVCVSPWLLNPEGTPRGGKLDMMRAWLQDRSWDRPALVMAQHRDVVEAAHAVAEGLGRKARYIHGGVSEADASKAIEAFNAGRLEVLVGSLATISEGLTLVAANELLLLETSFVPSRNEQAIRRVHRLGQTEAVNVFEYVAEQTVEVRKLRLLEQKTDRQIRMMTAGELAGLL